MNTGESLCEDCYCDQPALTTHDPLPATVKFYISLVRYGSAGWAALRAYTSIDACRIYPVSKVPTE